MKFSIYSLLSPLIATSPDQVLNEDAVMLELLPFFHDFDHLAYNIVALTPDYNLLEFAFKGLD